MNIATNPWSFKSTDVLSKTAAASPGGMVQQGVAAQPQSLRSVLLTTTAAHGLNAGDFITYINDTNGRFLGWYKVIAVPSATTALLENLSRIDNGQPLDIVVAASGGGTVLKNQVQQNLRAEDISLQGTGGAPGGSTTLIFLDRNGNLIWQADIGVTETAGDVAQNRGKIMWVDGITIQQMPTNIVALVTIN